MKAIAPVFSSWWRPLAVYTMIAFGVTWLLVAPIAASHQSWVDVQVSPWWHAVGALGPLAGALWVAHSTGTTAQLKAGWLRRDVSGWYYLAATSPLLLAAPAALIVRITDGTWPHVAGIATSPAMAGYGWLFMVLIPAVAYAIGEETGWRGFALPRLEERVGAWTATLILGVVWVAWHAPFYLYREGMVDTTVAEKVGQAIVIMIGGVFLTWLYNSTGGSILFVAIWHFTHSIVHVAVPSVSIEWDTWAGVLSTILAIAVAVIWRTGLTTRRPAHPLPTEDMTSLATGAPDTSSDVARRTVSHSRGGPE